ncbi:hypothetical protein B0H13DRAFT_2335596 [Mycena leptocephala]|nr:hypothetical protein B0H13DRAFT_2335596 [Mycena leptocephala]
MPSKATSAAKREAQARYRARLAFWAMSKAGCLTVDTGDRNKEELRRKAREAMARRRAQLTPAEVIEYRMTAREDAARYQADNNALLAQKALVCRARRSIAKNGYEEWCAKYKKRHQRPIPSILEPSSSSSTSSMRPPNVPQTCTKTKPSSSLPPSSPPSSTSPSMQEWIDCNLEKTPNAELMEDARRWERHAECEDVQTRVQAWLPRDSRH